MVEPVKVSSPAPAEAAALTQAINEAKTVALFVGAGVKDAREQVLQPRLGLGTQPGGRRRWWSR